MPSANLWEARRMQPRQPQKTMKDAVNFNQGHQGVALDRWLRRDVLEKSFGTEAMGQEAAGDWRVRTFVKTSEISFACSLLSL
jgi:hypothetical protein